jgi:hypothetical protein
MNAVNPNRTRRRNPVSNSSKASKFNSKSNAPPVKMPESINNIPIAAPAAASTNVPEHVTSVTASTTSETAAKTPTTNVPEPVISVPVANGPAATSETAAAAKTPTNVPEPVISVPVANGPAATSVPDKIPEPVSATVTEPATSVPVTSPLVQSASASDVLADGQPPASSLPDSDGQPASEPTIATNNNATNNNANIVANDAINAKAANANCMVYPSLFSSADPACYVPEQMPQLKQIVEAAIYDPISNMGSELLQNLLYATGNAALIEAAKAKALTPEQLALLNNVSNDPQVAAELKKFQDNLSNAVAQGIQQASETVAKPAQEAVGKLVNGTINTVLDDLKDIPPIGLISSGLTAVQTGVDAVENVTDIADKLKQAAAPVTQVMGEVGDLTAAMNNAASSAEGAASSAASSAEGDEASNAVAGSEAALPAPQFTKGDNTNNTNNTNNTKKSPFGTPTQTPEEEQEENNQLGGGSRKRRHIHKLSRRIERTLRRVQKKYGLKDKNDFLRRSLRRAKGHKGL